MLKLWSVLHGSLKTAQISAATLYKRLSLKTWGYKVFRTLFIRHKLEMARLIMPSLLHLPSFPMLLQLSGEVMLYPSQHTQCLTVPDFQEPERLPPQEDLTFSGLSDSSCPVFVVLKSLSRQ